MASYISIILSLTLYLNFTNAYPNSIGKFLKLLETIIDPNQKGIGLLMKMLNPNPVKRGSEYGSRGPIIYLFDSTSLSRQKWRFYIWQVP